MLLQASFVVERGKTGNKGNNDSHCRPLANHEGVVLFANRPARISFWIYPRRACPFGALVLLQTSYGHFAAHYQSWLLCVRFLPIRDHVCEWRRDYSLHYGWYHPHDQFAHIHQRFHTVCHHDCTGYCCSLWCVKHSHDSCDAIRSDDSQPTILRVSVVVQG